MASLVSWVQCNRCDKWRIVDNANMMDEEAIWFCEMNPNPFYNSCNKLEEVVDDVKSPKRYIQSVKNYEQPAIKRSKSITPEQELLASLKTWSTDQIREFWQKIDWQRILDLQRPHEPSLAEFKEWKNVDDDEFVSQLDTRVRASLPPRIAAQIPKMTSLRQQQLKLRQMLEQDSR